MSRPTDILSEEHQNILKVIKVITEECANLKSGKILDENFFKEVIDFIRNYADKFHHAKEEDILFAELNKASAHLVCNPVQQMLYEHNLGRDFVRGLEEGIKTKNQPKIIENGQGYAQLLSDHIFKEDNILYPLSNQALDKQTQDLMLIEFQKAEEKVFGREAKEKYLSLVKKFEQREGS